MLEIYTMCRRSASSEYLSVKAFSEYADDIVGFQYEAVVWRFRDMMRERLQEFSLQLHPDKTRLIAFGRFAALTRKKTGLGNRIRQLPCSTHFCGKDRHGGFQIRWKSRRDHRGAKLKEIRTEL